MKTFCLSRTVQLLHSVYYRSSDGQTGHCSKL